MKTIGIALIIITTTLIAADIITVKGSDTMVILSQRWAEEYMKKNPDVTIQVTGGGSEMGIKALINETTDICNASRPIKPSEKQKLKYRFNVPGVEIKVAKDGIALFVNKNNMVKELSLQQVKDIYTGRISNWKEVGGNDAPISLYCREQNSGSYVYFKENVLDDEEYSPACRKMSGTESLVKAVSLDPDGIGYGGAPYANGIREVPIKNNNDTVAYLPDNENIQTGKYPITRYLYMYMNNTPTKAIQKYIDWILSEEGQKIVSTVGYFPLQ